MDSRYLKIDDFDSHHDDAAAVRSLADQGCRFKLDANSRVCHLGARSGFMDDHVPLLLGLACLAEFSGLNFPTRASNFTDAGFSQIINHPTLNRFAYQGNPSLTDQALHAMTHATQLHYVGLPFCSVTDAGVASLSVCRWIEGLSLIGTAITDACVPHLCELSNLRQLYVRDTAITEQSAALLNCALPNCRIVT